MAMDVVNAGHVGGTMTAALYGSEHMKEIGARGRATRAERKAMMLKVLPEMIELLKEYRPHEREKIEFLGSELKRLQK